MSLFEWMVMDENLFNAISTWTKSGQLFADDAVIRYSIIKAKTLVATGDYYSQFVCTS